jgi:hypothetical protein
MLPFYLFQRREKCQFQGSKQIQWHRHQENNYYSPTPVRGGIILPRHSSIPGICSTTSPPIPINHPPPPSCPRFANPTSLAASSPARFLYGSDRESLPRVGFRYLPLSPSSLGSGRRAGLICLVCCVRRIRRRIGGAAPLDWCRRAVPDPARRDR